MKQDEMYSVKTVLGMSFVRCDLLIIWNLEKN
jgi:hypothetical protein